MVRPSLARDKRGCNHTTTACRASAGYVRALAGIPFKRDTPDEVMSADLAISYPHHQRYPRFDFDPGARNEQDRAEGDENTLHSVNIYSVYVVHLYDVPLRFLDHFV
jgi:hypothetical protein